MTLAAAAPAEYPADWDTVEAPPPGRDHRAEWQRRKLRVYAKACELRAQLRRELGGLCAVCGATDDLEFHHPKGRDWQPRKKSLLQRMRLYWRDHKVHPLTLLCSGCNTKIGSPGFWQRKGKVGGGKSNARRASR